MAFRVTILAGGAGKRLWPISRKKLPKQLLSIVGEKSLIELTVSRIRELRPDSIHLIATKELLNIIIGSLGRGPFSDVEFIKEPAARNTAACVCLISFMFDKDDILLVTPSDHYVEHPDILNKAIKNGITAAQRDNIVLFGIDPDRPETGYGYIEKGNYNKNGWYDICDFKEKPDEKTALIYLESGKYLWNAGIFLFKASTMQRLFRKFAPEYIEAVEAFLKGDGSLYGSLPKEPIDRLIIEKAKRRVVFGVDKAGWTDLGSWKSVKQIDKSVSNNLIVKDATDIYVKSEKKAVVVLGLSDIVIIDTGDALMIASEKGLSHMNDVYNELEDKMPEVVDITPCEKRIWGEYRILRDDKNYKVKVISLKPGHRLSLQSHTKRDECWTIVEGEGIVTLNNKRNRVKKGDVVVIKKDMIHRIENTGADKLVFVEVQTGQYLGEDDIIRYEDDYGRL